MTTLFKTTSTSLLIHSLLLTCLAMLSACSEQNNHNEQQAPQLKTVQTMPVIPVSQYSVTRLFAGSIQSKQQAKLNFEINGKVAAIYVDDGTNVEAGDKLASLDTELLHLEQQQLLARLNQVMADIELVNNNIRRLTSLAKQGYVSEQNIDELIAQKKVLGANKQQIQAQIDAKQYQIRRADIYAPFSGTINKRSIHVGEVVTPQHIAFELNQNNQKEVKVGLPKQVAMALAKQQRFTLLIDQQEFISDTVFINSSIDPASRTVQARFHLDTGVSSFNNQLAYLKVEQQFQQDGYWVPLSALTDGVRGSWNIYTLTKAIDKIEDNGKDSPVDEMLDESNRENQKTVYRVIHHTVEVIHTEQDKAFIRGAVNQQQLLVASGLHRIVPGQLVYAQKGP